MNLIASGTVLVKRWLQKIASAINHEAVIKDIALETDISVGYFLILSTANLIALSGLITNSAPVIIGAMLISPLMGPILSFGFAFISGSRTIWKRSIKKIVISVAVTLFVAAVAAFFSPLKEVTSEILTRTRPNLYDLIVAFLAGSAGAVALCTKKNYLTIVPGVAIATAVIPPLSVAGFGIGTQNYSLFLGGFFLFFTNFVAITIATSVIFYIYGFRPKMLTETDIVKMKRRMAYLGTVLLIISIPLIYTLHVSIGEVRLRSEVGRLLKKGFDQEKQSRLTNFDYIQKKDGRIEISAVINTVDYLDEDKIMTVEKDISGALRQGIHLSVEQVKVQPGGLKPQVINALAPLIASPKAPVDVIKTSRESVIAVVRQSAGKIEKVISPSTVTDFTVGFRDKSLTFSIVMKIKRDKPVSDEERLWLNRMIATDLNLPVDLSIETEPFMPALVFQRGEIALSEEMKKALLTLQDAYKREPTLQCRIEAFPESGVDSARQKKLAQKRAAATLQYLVNTCKIPQERIQAIVLSKSRHRPEIKVSILSENNVPQDQKK
jgi:uncharacterized hydrophobic protein (TIGR00271 family)